MEDRQQGLLETEPLHEVEEDVVSEVDLNNCVSEEEREEIQTELAKLEDEIATLKQVLAAKEKQHAELRQKLGITAMGELRNNINKGWQEMQTSTAYKKTSETLSTAGLKTSAAFSTLGTVISKRLGDMRFFGLELLYPRRSNSIGNSPSFKSFEERVENTVTNLKSKVGGTGSGGSFEEVLSSAAKASAQNTTNTHQTESNEDTC